MKKLTYIILLLFASTLYAADTKLSALSELTTVADADLIYIVDVTGTTSLKITVLNLFDTIDTFAELNTIVADKTLANLNDAMTWVALGTFNLGITITTGDPFTLGAVRWDDGSDQIDGEQIANDTIDDDSIDFVDVTGADLTLTDAGAITSTGTITATVGFDIVGAADIDYGSADVTDHTFITDGTGTAEVVLPTGSIDGTEILDDTVDSADYAADSIDNEHINWSDIDNLGDEGTITVADTTDTTSYVALWESATGDLAAKSDGGLLYDAGTATLAVGGSLTVSGSVTVSYILEAATLTEGGNAVYSSGETPSGELGGTYANITIDDGVAVSSWNLTTPTFTTTALLVGILQDNDDMVFECDADSDGSNKYSFTDGAATEIAALTEAGALQLDSNLTIGANADVDYTLTFDGDTSDGVLNYDEDNAEFEFDQNVVITGSLTVTGSVTVSDILEAATLTEGGNAVWNASETDILDSGHYIADSIDNEHINWADIDNLGNEGAVTLAATVTVSDDESTDDDQEIVFTTDNATLESDGDFHYSPDTGTVTATEFVGGGAGLTGTLTAYDDIADPDASGSISFDDGETATYTGTNDGAISFFTIQNSDADHTGGNLYLLDLDYSADDGDADADFIKFQDSGGVVMTIQQGGEIATDGGITAGGTVEGATITEGGQAVWNATETDILDSGHYIAGSIDYEHLADDVISGAAAVGTFESGDTFLVLEAGVGLREVDYDDLPGAAGVTAWDDIGDPDAAATIDFVTYTQTIDIGKSDSGGGDGLILDVTGLGAGPDDVTALLITTVANDDTDYIPMEVYDDSGGSPDLLFEISSTGRVYAKGGVYLSGGALLDSPIPNFTVTSASDVFTLGFGGTDIDILWSDGVLNLRNQEDGVDAIVEIEGKDANEKGILRVLSDGDDKNIELYHDDTDGHILTSSGDLHIEPDNKLTVITGSLTVTGSVTVSYILEAATLTEGGVAVINATEGGAWTGTHDLTGATVSMPKRTSNDERFFSFNVWNPNAVYDTDTQICFEPNLPAAITITEVTVTLDADPTTELDWDLKWADAFIGLGNAALIVAIDTTSGTTDVDSGFDDATVAAGKCLYIEMAADPDSNIKQAIVKIRYDFD